MKLALILLLAPLLPAQIFSPPGSVRRYAGTPTAGDCTASAIGRRAVDYSAIPSAHYKCSQTSSGVYEWEAEGSGGGSGGDITAVTAGSGLTGGGTSGAVTVSIAADLERLAAGRWKFYDATGPTTVTIQAGSAQSSTVLQQWLNAAGSTLATVSATGYFTSPGFASGTKIAMAYHSTTDFTLASDSFVAWRNATSVGSGTADLGLARSSANNLAVTNGSSTEYWRLGLGGIQSGVTTWNDPASSGTVASKSILGIAAPTLTASSSTTFTTASTLRIGGAPTASTNVTIGTPYALEVAAGNSFLAGNLTLGGSIGGATGISTTGSFLAGASGIYYWTGRSVIASPSNGNITISNQLATDFGLLQFGGTTSSFPALKRSTTGLAVRLADDSADAPITASNVTASADIIGASTSCLYLGATGTDGTWRICRSSTSIVFERRESGSYVSKGNFTP